MIPVGTPKGEALRGKWGSEAMQEHGTTHLSVVDGYGNAVSMTATIDGENSRACSIKGSIELPTASATTS